MNIKTIAIAALLTTALAAGARTDYLTLPAGRAEMVDLGFAPKGRKIIGKELVAVSLRDGATTATITAGEVQGTCQVEFFDAGGGEGLILEVEVVGDLDDTLRALRKWLADFNDLEFVKGKNTIAITGTIGTPSEWAKFQKICALSDFKGKIESVVEFSVDPATIAQLRKQMVAEGLPLADAGTRPAEGQFAMSYEHNVLMLTGTVYSQNDLDKIVRVLQGQSWLEIVNGAPKDAATSTVAKAVVNVTVDDALLEMGVAFVLIDKKELQQRTSTGRLVLGAAWDGITDLLLIGGHRDSQHGKWNNVRLLETSLSSTLNMLANNGVSRQKEYGTFRFHANGDPGKTLHIGGSMKVTPPASGEGEAPEAQDYDYGFKVINKNSRRISADTAEADIDIELFGEPMFNSVGGAVTVNQQKRSVSPLVRIPLEQTVAVAGYESLFEFSNGGGTPFLRHIPIVNWFVSDKVHDYKDLSLLFLVSIRKVDLENEKPMVENSPMRDITLDADTGTEDRAKAERKAKKSWW